MKKYIVFSISFVSLFVVFQFLYGYFMTLFYTPDMASAWSQIGSLSSSIVIKGSSSLFPLLLALLAATIAHFTPRLFMKTSSK